MMKVLTIGLLVCIYVCAMAWSDDKTKFYVDSLLVLCIYTSLSSYSLSSLVFYYFVRLLLMKKTLHLFQQFPGLSNRETVRYVY